jgi:hypothetical protein
MAGSKVSGGNIQGLGVEDPCRLSTVEAKVNYGVRIKTNPRAGDFQASEISR